ncbi:MogA/MoaB family molybdenum cofactor biosynthesis protein [Microbacterium sp. MEC084]|jgi:molybdenum cofactor synthesis domain-containing protein|uniref:MogA/MoaB family molybdenum cofactor biosynthesis protein n=1 Tax=unclassified Microbacterium TaxID=2609290 RepID=UPI0006FCA21D|nr:MULTISPECIES: MogA/MoaB family molybdenum cofactor biosynthesis protein [unclassified Microbacterium]KQY99228.1 molybdenum cofactor biosynthesis protein [Microbacterium sp. Root53]MCD1269124.1 MogA/MoaB family molybdenum cofactor biosynthesis protein [Microbacterium sp. MEC084]
MDDAGKPPRAAVITVSDRSARGEREDLSGPEAVAALRVAGFDCDDAVVVPDGAESVERALAAMIAAGAGVIVTTGGTGLGPRDQTPEGTLRVIQREVPGIAEELRRIGAAEKPAGMLSRGVAGVAHGTLIVNLPGSPAAVRSGMPVVVSIARHAASQLAGEDH